MEKNETGLLKIKRVIHIDIAVAVELFEKMFKMKLLGTFQLATQKLIFSPTRLTSRTKFYETIQR